MDMTAALFLSKTLPGIQHSDGRVRNFDAVLAPVEAVSVL
jgi:hypothetical protein